MQRLVVMVWVWLWEGDSRGRDRQSSCMCWLRAGGFVIAITACLAWLNVLTTLKHPLAFYLDTTIML